jgi:trimethylamine:corrinoid methyltransferase-like protein
MLNLKPQIRVMTEEQIHKVHKDALLILGETGVIVDDPGAKSLFQKAIGAPQKDQRIRIPNDLIQWAIKSAPADIQIYDRLGKRCFELKGDGTRNTVFGIGVTNLNYQDPYKNKIHPFYQKDMASAAGLGHNLEAFDFISTPGVIQDRPPTTADLHGIIEMTANTTKPVVMLISNPDCFLPALELCERLHEDISRRPFLIPYVNPITPLVLNTETTMKMDTTIRKGLPLIFSNYGMSGATCPITPAGTLALLLAELLAGLVYSQLVKQGTPIILGSHPAAFDMKNAGSFYSPQSLLLNLACAEMIASYNIPHCGTSGCGNGWGADLLAGTTMCINHLTSVLGSVGMVPFVGGNFDSLVFSPELVVFADDLIVQSRMFASGFSIEDEALGRSDISEVGPGGNFLLSNLTGKFYKASRFTSTIWPFLTLDKWQDLGSPSADNILKARTCEILDSLKTPEDRDDIISKGDAFLNASF